MIVVVHGPDAATARAEVAKLVAIEDPDGTGTTFLDGRTISIGHAIAMVGTPGFLGKSRVIVIEDLVTRAVKGKTPESVDSESIAPSSASIDLASLFASVAPGNVLVMIDISLSTVPVAIRKIAPADTKFIAGDPLRDQALLKWMQLIAQQAGSGLSLPDATYLAELLFPQTWRTKPANPQYDRPPDLAKLQSEIEKLALFAHPGHIERQQIDEMTEANGVDRLFPFLEAVQTGALGQAVVELQALKDIGEDGHRLMAQLFQQIELAAVQEAAPSGSDPMEVGRSIGLPNPNRMYGIARTRRLVPAKISLREARRCDQAIKTGTLRDPMDVLYALTGAMSRQRGNQHDDGAAK